MNEKLEQARQAISKQGVLYHFLPRLQRQFLGELMLGEEGEFYIEKILEYVDRVNGMPQTGETNGPGQDAIAYLHYFGPADAWITEKDVGDGTDDLRQHQAYGLVSLHGTGARDAELGYVSIEELIQTNLMELDLHWVPRPLHSLDRPVTPKV